MPDAPLIYRKGLNLGDEVAADLTADYHSELVERTKDNGFRYESPGLVVHLAREFGFCYGVDRAVDYAYQARRRFPSQRVYLTGEIIHNPQVNDRLRSLGVRFLSDPGESVTRVEAVDVVILPAFGVPVQLLVDLQRRGCTLVDTTCGSVLNVWKNVRRYAQEGYTSVIHGKVYHEETRATASQALQSPDGRYLVVLDRDEAAVACDAIGGRLSRAAFMSRFAHAVSEHFDPERDLCRIGLANQTTMLMSESLAIGEMFRAAMRERYGASELDAHFRTFETICSATQDRQDAIISLLDEHPLDLMVVIGGYNSSNTSNLARICAPKLPTYHISGPDCLRSAAEVRHCPVGSHEEITTTGWLPDQRPVKVGLTAGASTPDVMVGAVIERLREFSA